MWSIPPVVSWLVFMGTRQVILSMMDFNIMRLLGMPAIGWLQRRVFHLYRLN